MSYFNYKGKKVYYNEYGNGEPLLLLHGNTASSKMLDEAMQVIEFIRQSPYEKVNIIGTSGGVISAINVALENPESVNKIIADSFEGEHLSIISNTTLCWFALLNVVGLSTLVYFN